MPLIAITCPRYATPLNFVEALSAFYNCPSYEDIDIVKETAQVYDLKKELIFNAFQGGQIPFENFTHDRQKCMAALKVQITYHICNGSCIFSGILSHLIQEPAPLFFRILANTPWQYRITQAMEKEGKASQDVKSYLTKADRRTQWFADSLGLPSLLNPVLHHMSLEWQKTDQTTYELTADQIDGILKEIDSNQLPALAIKKETAIDLHTSARVEFALAGLGHTLIIDSQAGHILVTLDRKVMNLARAQQEILDLAGVIPGVKSVKTKIGPNYYKGSITKNLDFSTPFRRKPKDP